MKFGTIGFLGTMVNISIFYINQTLIFKNIVPPETRLNVSLTGAIFVSTLHNFFWNRIWTWRDRRKNIKKTFFLQMGQYFIASFFSIALQFIFTNALALLLHYLIANIIAIILAAIINYLVNDTWTFSLRKPQ
ncbi:MAG: GtrA family protein [Desulfobacterales bacterium]|nr:GtrA family protein [Desulfobacterales bacterium]